MLRGTGWEILPGAALTLFLLDRTHLILQQLEFRTQTWQHTPGTRFDLTVLVVDVQ